MLSATLLALVLGCGDAPPVPTAPPPAAVPANASDDDLETRRKALVAEVRALVAELEGAGRYDCCVKTACTWCAMHTGGCACGEGLRRGDPVCEECALGWELGSGAEPVDPTSVHSFTEYNRLRTGKICGRP